MAAHKIRPRAMLRSLNMFIVFFHSLSPPSKSLRIHRRGSAAGSDLPLKLSPSRLVNPSSRLCRRERSSLETLTFKVGESIGTASPTDVRRGSAPPLAALH